MPAAQRNWTRAETILAFALYCTTPRGQDIIANPELQDLAQALGRTANSVKLKLQNFKSLDPSYTLDGRKGLANASAMDREVAAEFLNHWQELVLEAEKLKAQFGLNADCAPAAADNAEADLPDGRDIIRAQKARSGQGFFRAALLSSYGQCCISGMKLPALLRASHIKPWAAASGDEKLNPANGLLLNALFDAAFDQGYITVRPDYRIALSPQLLRGNDAAARAAFLPFDGQPIRLPSRFLPARAFLEYHNDCVFLK